MNVAILCGFVNSTYARGVLRALNARGLRRINVVAAGGDTTPKTVKGLWQKYRWTLPRVALRWTAARLNEWRETVRSRKMASTLSLEAETIGQGGKFIVVRELNGEEGCAALRSLQTDLTILAGTPIIRAPVLAVPRIGTLNAHQGALPRFRGMNVIEWAIFEECPPTISVHFVDPGVDTGDIVAEEPVPLRSGDTLKSVRERAGARQVDLLADTAAAVLAGQFSRRSQRADEGRQYFTMHPRLRAIAERRLQQKIVALSNG